MLVDRCTTLDFPRPMPPSFVHMLGAGLSEEPGPMSEEVARFVEGAQGQCSLLVPKDDIIMSQLSHTACRALHKWSRNCIC